MARFFFIFHALSFQLNFFFDRRFPLTVGMNHISEQLNEYLLKTTRTGLKHNQF